MPIVEVIHSDRCTVEQKRRLAKALNDAVRQHFGAKKVYVVFDAVSAENFAEDGTLRADAPQAPRPGEPAT
jgi:phenylpyruvate tautomerase PptA (4-oxalocrotonate tautomerase family)